MFDALSDRLGAIFDRLKGRGALNESDVNEALREVRVALLEADVALGVVKDFIDRVKVKAVGQEVLRSITPGQQVIKIVHDELVTTLGGEGSDLDLVGVPPMVVMMVGLQGSGKTTSTAKIAKRLRDKSKLKVLMASLDVARPAAQEQLKILGQQVDIPTLPVIAGQMPVDIAKRALQSARLQGFDVILLDTAGRLHVDASLMAELSAVKQVSSPLEILLVADALTGQDAVTIAREFDTKIGITGAVLTRMDGDGRGGAALSLRAVTGKPIKLIGTGEKLDAIEAFHPERVAGRILGMGDVVSLVEKAVATMEMDDAEAMARRMAKGEFDLNDMRTQLQQMTKLGGMKGVLGLLPGMGKITKQIEQANVDDRVFKRQEAIINSMTPKERVQPKIIAANRKKRIAAGSGTSVQDVNKLLKMHQDMATMMKRMKKMGKKGLMPGMLPPGMDKLLPRG